jgi:hypothetical protein
MNGEGPGKLVFGVDEVGGEGDAGGRYGQTIALIQNETGASGRQMRRQND